jgi:two-component system chemotaxis response regulator CheB
MEKRNIIVIGASAGGFEAIKRIIHDLPLDMDASIFVVWHMSPDIRGILPQVLNRVNSIYAAHALDKEEIKPNRIYIAPPDHHMLLENGMVRVTHGPKENRFRPAVDPLFRSAAYTYNKRVIGVVLTGALDDGTAGLWTIKHYGGIAVVQDPSDAEVPSMPENAIREVAVDYTVSVREIAPLLVTLSKQEVEIYKHTMQSDERIKVELRIAEDDSAFESGIMKFGALSPFTCPECHGVLSTLKDGERERYRCHTGHAYSADSLLAAITDKIEDSLYSAMRGVEESVMLLNHMGDHFAESNHPKLAALYFQKAQDAEARAQLVRKAVLSHEQLSKDSMRQMAQTNSDKDQAAKVE